MKSYFAHIGAGILSMFALIFGIPKLLGIIGTGLPDEKKNPEIDGAITGFSSGIFNSEGGLDSFGRRVLIVSGVVVGTIWYFVRPYLPKAIALMAVVGGVMTNNSEAGVITSVFLFTIDASVQQTKQVQYLPQVLVFQTATVPTLLQVTVAGKGTIVNLDGAGITAVNKLKKVGTMANTYAIFLGDGCLTNTNVTITIANATATAIDVFGSSESPINAMFRHNVQNVLAKSGYTFRKFAYLVINSPEANDQYTVNFRNGWSQIYSFLELQALSIITQDINTVLIDNFDQQIDNVNIIPVSTKDVYYGDYQAV